jgi:hypothetical protein
MWGAIYTWGNTSTFVQKRATMLKQYCDVAQLLAIVVLFMRKYFIGVCFFKQRGCKKGNFPRNFCRTFLDLKIFRTFKFWQHFGIPVRTRRKIVTHLIKKFLPSIIGKLRKLFPFETELSLDRNITPSSTEPPRMRFCIQSNYRYIPYTIRTQPVVYYIPPTYDTGLTLPNTP